MNSTNRNYSDAIRRHYSYVWKCDAEEAPLPVGPAISDEFAVLRFPPREQRMFWTYATCGMSTATEQSGIELHKFSDDRDDTVAEILAATAHYHRAGSRLDIWHIVNFGRPWRLQSRCSHALISLPYLDGPMLENCSTPDGLIRCLWLLPITPEERRFSLESGPAALVERFETMNVEYARATRASVI